MNRKLEVICDCDCATNKFRLIVIDAPDIFCCYCLQLLFIFVSFEIINLQIPF